MSWLVLLWACSCSEEPVAEAPEPAPVEAPAAPKPIPARADVQIGGDFELRTSDLPVKCSPEMGVVSGRGWEIEAHGIDGPIEIRHQDRTFRVEKGAKRWKGGWKFSTELPEEMGDGKITASVTIDCGNKKGTPKKK